MNFFSVPFAARSSNSSCHFGRFGEPGGFERLLPRRRQRLLRPFDRLAALLAARLFEFQLPVDLGQFAVDVAKSRCWRSTSISVASDRLLGRGDVRRHRLLFGLLRVELLAQRGGVAAGATGSPCAGSRSRADSSFARSVADLLRLVLRAAELALDARRARGPASESSVMSCRSG